MMNTEKFLLCCFILFSFRLSPAPGPLKKHRICFRFQRRSLSALLLLFTRINYSLLFDVHSRSQLKFNYGKHEIKKNSSSSGRENFRAWAASETYTKAGNNELELDVKVTRAINSAREPTAKVFNCFQASIECQFLHAANSSINFPFSRPTEQ